MIAVQETIYTEVTPFVSKIAERYELNSLRPLIESTKAFADRDEISVAVIGRFKAGKSSFLNHFLTRALLPIGVTPVTAVVTEIGYGKQERSVAQFLDGHSEDVALDQIRHFIAERDNPGNVKQVSIVKVELPELAGVRGLRFVDMPGLESALSHNTEAALNWLPNVGLALVAISVDPPLSRQDIALLKTVFQYTPKVSILLTKIDLLSEAECEEVIGFVQTKLEESFGTAPKIYPYSIRSGYEKFKRTLEEDLVRQTLRDFEDNRNSVLRRKLKTALRECNDYLALALKSADAIGQEREALNRLLQTEKQSLNEVKSELRLVVNHAAGATRLEVATRFSAYQRKLEDRLFLDFEKEFPSWTRSLSVALDSYEKWLRDALTRELVATSSTERRELLAPLQRLTKQVFRTLQNFRDRLSDKTDRAFGLPLRTTESEINVEEPRNPDIYIGKVFDRNWELLSPVAPMTIFRPVLRRHFVGKVPYMVEKNLSRLTTQWDKSIRAAMMKILQESQHRMDELIATVERLIQTTGNAVPEIRSDLQKVNLYLNRLEASERDNVG